MVSSSALKITAGLIETALTWACDCKELLLHVYNTRTGGENEKQNNKKVIITNAGLNNGDAPDRMRSEFAPDRDK